QGGVFGNLRRGAGPGALDIPVPGRPRVDRFRGSRYDVPRPSDMAGAGRPTPLRAPGPVLDAARDGDLAQRGEGDLMAHESDDQARPPAAAPDERDPPAARKPYDPPT